MSLTPSSVIAVVGVGALAEGIVDGLCRDADPTIVLSPRNAARSKALAERHPSVRVAGSNQDAVDAADVVLVCVRPQDADAVLAPLVFRADQHVEGVLAATTVERLAMWVAPAHLISRAVPTPAVADHVGVTPVFPAGSVAEEIFAGLGTAVALDDEAQMEAVQTASATVATHLSYLATITDWMVARGVDRAKAHTLVAGLFASLAPELTASTSFETLRADHATPGGVNETLERRLREAGVFGLVAQGLDSLVENPFSA